jgi:hypothetical protein
MQEITFNPDCKIGYFSAFDYFGDGSFYLLDAPGHAIGHMTGLVRTTSTTFMLLGADTCHFAGSLRPSKFVPLPANLDVVQYGLDSYFPNPCPCVLFADCHPGASEEEKRTTPYYTASTTPGSAYVDPSTADKTVAGTREFDASPDIFVCLAHDPALFEVLPLLNQDPAMNANDWQVKGFKDMTLWRFLNELPRDKQPGREPIVFGFWRDGVRVEIEEAMRK